MYMKYKLNVKIRHTAAWCGLRTTICSAYESHRLNFRGFLESFGMNQDQEWFNLLGEISS